MSIAVGPFQPSEAKSQEARRRPSWADVSSGRDGLLLCPKQTQSTQTACLLNLGEDGRPASAKGKLSAAGNTASDHHSGLKNRDAPEPVLHTDRLYDTVGSGSTPCHRNYEKGV